MTMRPIRTLALQAALAASAAFFQAAPPASLPAGRTLAGADLDKALEPLLGTDWFGVYLKDGKVGWMRTDFVRLPGGAYEVTTALVARFKAMGVEQEMRIRERRRYAGPGRRLVRIEFVQGVGGRALEVTGAVKGGAFEVTRKAAGETRATQAPLPRESLADAMRVQLLARDPRAPVGTSALFYQFEPTNGREYRCRATLVDRRRVSLEGVQTTLVSVETLVEEMGIKSLSKLTPDGRILETAMGGIFKVRREPEKIARRLDVAIDPLALAAIRIDRDLPEVRRLEEIVLEVSGLEEARYRLDTPRQTYRPTKRPGVYRLTLERGDWPAGGARPEPGEADRIRRALAPSPFVQSDHPEIIALARSIVGDETDPRRRVEKLVRWVFENVKSRYTAASSTALDVLQTRAGDCTEHTVLFLALCRALGIPAEEVTGVVYGQGMGAFVYHAWARVHVGGWVEVDPTWNETRVNPSHVAFTIGPFEKQVGLVGIMGRVKFRYVSHK